VNASSRPLKITKKQSSGKRPKPIRFGFKLWVLASDSGYPYYFIVYCGKSTGPNSDQVTKLGLGHQVVTSLLSIVSIPECHEVFFDNYFTSYDLLRYLKSIKIKATETARENRLKQCPLQDTKLMKKTPRGTHDSKCDYVVGIVKWHDNQCRALFLLRLPRLGMWLACRACYACGGQNEVDTSTG